MTLRSPVFVLACAGGWCHGAVLQSVGRSEALPSTPALPGRGPGPGSFLSVVRSSERPRRRHLPGPSRGRGRGPSGDARSAAPRGLAELWAMCRILATEVHRRLISDCNGRQTDLASSFGRGLGSMSPPLAVVFVSVHYIGLPPARVAVYAWLTVPTRGGNRGRGHRGCIAVVVACGARRPFAHGSWLFARVLGKRGKRGYNKWSASRLL